MRYSILCLLSMDSNSYITGTLTDLICCMYLLDISTSAWMAIKPCWCISRSLTCISHGLMSFFANPLPIWAAFLFSNLTRLNPSDINVRIISSFFNLTVILNWSSSISSWRIRPTRPFTKLMRFGYFVRNSDNRLQLCSWDILKLYESLLFNLSREFIGNISHVYILRGLNSHVTPS